MKPRSEFHDLTRIVIGVVILVFAAGLAVALASAPAPASVATHWDSRDAVAEDQPIDISNLADRAAWHQVNAKPYRISSVLNVLCDAPSPDRVDEERKRNPHASTLVTVFVNETGRAAMYAKNAPSFPVGSVIVKQKFEPYGERAAPILSTVMVKRERGYNQDVGDWEFAVVGSDGREIRARGKLANCAACHTPERANDFVFRSYLER